MKHYPLAGGVTHQRKPSAPVSTSPAALKAADLKVDPAKLTLEELNKRTAVNSDAQLPSQQDSISSANDEPPTGIAFAALVSRVAALEAIAKPAPKKRAPAKKK